MTVQNTIVKNVYVGNGSTTIFPFTFECNKAEHIQAFVKDALGNISSTTNFKVDLEQKNLTYPNTGEPLANGDKLIILRQLPLQQLLNLLNQGPFYAEDIEETFDEVVMMLQQMTERIGRSLAVSVDIDAENSFNTIIPLEAGKTFRVKDDGTGFEVTEDPGKVIDGAKALLKQTTEQAEFAKEQADASSQSAFNAQNAANTAEKIATDLGLVNEAVQTAVASAEQAGNSTATASNKADVATAKADIATDKANEANLAANTATAKADAANQSAINAAQSYANADAVATQLTEYLATKETLTAPAVDKTLLIEGAAADSKVVGELKSDLSNIGKGLIIEGGANSTKFIKLNLVAGEVYYIKNNTNGNLDITTNDGNDSTSNIIQHLDSPFKNDIIEVTINQNAPYLRIYFTTNGSVLVVNKNSIVGYIEKNLSECVDFKNNATPLVNTFTSKKNLCTDLTPNTIYSAWGGVGTSVIRESADGYTSAIVELNGDEEFITMTVKTDEPPFSFFADADGKMISNVFDHYIRTNVYSVPANAKFLYGTIQTKNIEDINLGMVVFKGSERITQNDFNINEIPYGQTRLFADDLKTINGTSIIDIEKSIKPIYVEKDGSGDFTRLIDAIEEAEKTMNRVVYVGAGEWDIIEELGTDYIESINSSKRGVYLKNGIHLICSSRSIIKCNYTGTNESTIEWLSAFNAGDYGFTLENATIESSNCRYTVHDERDSDGDQYTNIYKNCFMKHTRMNGYAQCIGGGLGLDGHVIIDGCKFVNSEGDNSVVVSYHNSGDGYWEGTVSKGAQSNVEVTNSWFSGTFSALTFGQSIKETNFLVHGNSFASSPVYPLEPNPVIKVTDWNNEIRNN